MSPPSLSSLPRHKAVSFAQDHTAPQSLPHRQPVGISVRSGDAARSVAALLDSDKAAMAMVAQAVAIARMEPCFPGGREDSYGRGGPSEGGSYASSRRA